MIWKASEWQGGAGDWYCNCVDNLGAGSGLWYIPARILGITPAAFIELLITEYKPDYIFGDKEKCLFFFSWKSQSQMRKYKNMINAEARKKNFQI